jgi:hypothetical protein
MKQKIFCISLVLTLLVISGMPFGAHADELSLRQLLALHKRPPQTVVLVCPSAIRSAQECDDLVAETMTAPQIGQISPIRDPAHGTAGWSVQQCDRHQFAMEDRSYGPLPIVPQGPSKIFDLKQARPALVLVVMSGYRPEGAIQDLPWRGYFVAQQTSPCEATLFDYHEPWRDFNFVEEVRMVERGVSFLALSQQDEAGGYYSGELHVFESTGNHYSILFKLNFLDD